jgi:hypothetical protein
MSKIIYKAEMIIFVHHPDKEKPEGKRIEILRFPVQSFEVDGAGGKIDLASSDEQRIVCQFNQARAQKNIIFYLKQGKDMKTDMYVPAAKIINLPKSEQKNFTVSFSVRFIKGETTLRNVSLLSSANFSETPIPVGKTPPLLKMKLSFKSSELYNSVGGQKTEVMSQISC